MLSLEDKLAIALHDFAAVTAEDFVPFDYCDGPNGVRGHQGATAFPSTLALAASFDRDLARRYGAALGREVLAAGKNAILAPAMDIARVPHGGRGGENLGEDPMLAGESAAPSVVAFNPKASSLSPSTTWPITSSGCVPGEGSFSRRSARHRHSGIAAHAP